MEALTDCRRPVSGTISLPSRGTFHHSLTVLSAIGHKGYLALPSGLGTFTRDSTSPVLLRNTHTQEPGFQLRGSHPLRQAFPNLSPIHSPLSLRQRMSVLHRYALQHHTHNPRQVSHMHGLGSSAFARHYSQNISSKRY